MRWAKTTKHQVIVVIDFQPYRVACEGEDGEDYALSINGEYVRDVSALPEYEELREIIHEEVTLVEESRAMYPSDLERNLL